MAFSHGKSTVVSIDNAAGSLQNLSAYCNESSFPTEVEASEVTVYGNGNKQYIPGLADSTFSCGGPFDPVLNTHMNGIRTGQIAGTVESVTIQWSPAGSGSGAPLYSGEGILTSYEPSSSVGDPNSWSAEFQMTGAITLSTH